MAVQGGHTSKAHKGSGWTESPEMYGRAILDCCQKITLSLSELLEEVYGLIYDKQKNPTFLIPIAPNMPYEMLLPLFDAQVLDDIAYSHIFRACTGYPLGNRALSAREDRHNAQNVMPFVEGGEGEAKKPKKSGPFRGSPASS
jgi:hypothetical protein